MTVPDSVRVETVSALTAEPIGSPGTDVRCSTCGGHLFADADVTGYAYRYSDEPMLRVARLYCSVCNHRELRFPSLGVHEIMFDAVVRQRLGSLLLDDVSVLDYSPPTAGR